MNQYFQVNRNIYILEYCSNSKIINLLIFSQIEYKFEPSMFPKYKYWTIHKNQKQFLEQLSKKYNIQNPNEWGKITTKMVNNSIYYYLESIYFNNILHL